MTQTVQQRSTAESNLIRQAWADEGLKSELLANPTKVYAKAVVEAGGSLSESTEVRVLEESANTLFLVIPNLEVTGTEQTPLDDRSTRAELEASILLEAMKSREAKSALLADPRGVYASKVATVREGAKLPESMSVEVVEESDSVLYFRLPEAPPEQSGELSEEELAAVAGGVVAVGVAVTSTVVAAVVIGAVLLAEQAIK